MAVRRVSAVGVAWDQLMRRSGGAGQEHGVPLFGGGGIPDAVDVGFAQGTNILPHRPEAEVSGWRVQG